MSVSDKDTSAVRMASLRRALQVLTMERHLKPVEFWMSLLLVLFLLLLAALGFTQPVAAASGFGIPLVDSRDAFYLLVKGDRDLGSALALGTLLWLGHRRALGAVVLAMTVEPILDAILLVSDPRGALAHALAVHGTAAIYCVVLAWRLLRAPHAAEPVLARVHGVNM